MSEAKELEKARIAYTKKVDAIKKKYGPMSQPGTKVYVIGMDESEVVERIVPDYRVEAYRNWERLGFVHGNRVDAELHAERLKILASSKSFVPVGMEEMSHPTIYATTHNDIRHGYVAGQEYGTYAPTSNKPSDTDFLLLGLGIVFKSGADTKAFMDKMIALGQKVHASKNA